MQGRARAISVAVVLPGALFIWGLLLWIMKRIEVDIAKEWLSVADICDYMGVSAYVVTGVLRAGDLPAVKFGREWRVARLDFEDWINEGALP